MNNYYNKDVADLLETSVNSIYQDENPYGFSKYIKYELFNTKKFPRYKYDIKILDCIFDKFKLDSRTINFLSSNQIVSECLLILKVNVTDIYNCSNIYYLVFDYNFRINCIIDIDTTHLYVKEIYIQGKNIMKDIVKQAKEKIPGIIKEINPGYYFKNKGKFKWR